MALYWQLLWITPCRTHVALICKWPLRQWRWRIVRKCCLDPAPHVHAVRKCQLHKFFIFGKKVTFYFANVLHNQDRVIKQGHSQKLSAVPLVVFLLTRNHKFCFTTEICPLLTLENPSEIEIPALSGSGWNSSATSYHSTVVCTAILFCFISLKYFLTHLLDFNCQNNSQSPWPWPAGAFIHSLRTNHIQYEA